MVEFRSKDLGKQVASVDLSYEVDRHGYLGNIVGIFQPDGSVMFHRVRAHKKTQAFLLSSAEFLKVAQAYVQFQEELCDAQNASETALALAVHDAHALAASVQFDLESLNVLVQESAAVDGWAVGVPALSYRRYVELNEGTEHLVQLVKNTFDYIRINVEATEKRAYVGEEYQEIVASYRRAFPLEPAEPQEIVEARALLAEAGLTDWLIAPRGDGWYTFDHDHEHGTFSTGREPAKWLLSSVKAYLDRRASDALLAAIERGNDEDMEDMEDMEEE